MTVSSVSNQADFYVPTAPSGTHPSTQPKQQPAQDSVQLSPQAKAAASGDVDHDGDSR
jgi:hypothetical protein